MEWGRGKRKCKTQEELDVFGELKDSLQCGYSMSATGLEDLTSGGDHVLFIETYCSPTRGKEKME